jgi:polysaccharide export outer membrane protein
MTVNIVGEVTRPGGVAVPPNTTLNQAILAAGGFNNSRARRNRVELIRLNPNGTVTKRTVAVDLAAGINETTNPLLRPNDVVVVGRSTLAETSDFLGSLLSPLNGIFSVFRLFGF